MPKEQEKRVSLSAEEGKHQRLPGMWQAAMIAGLSALVVGYCVQRNAGSFNPPAEGSVSRVAEVGPEDLAGAITTLDISSADGTQFRERKDCVHRLAWVTIALAPGQPAGQIRLQSGNYLSPAFALTNTPIRVALPYPAPYTVGHGTLSIFWNDRGRNRGADAALARACERQMACAGSDLDACRCMPRSRPVACRQ